jgi:hypothetical protein
MKFRLFQSKPWVLVGTDPANDLDAFVPEVWAQESLMVLEENMVIAGMVHRDFSSEIASFGDTVNTRRPAAFEMKRKADRDEVTVQAAEATNVPVVLNMWPHVSFIIGDGEESKGFKSLRDEYLVPALQALAVGIDQMLLYQVYAFLANQVGSLGTDLTKSSVTALRAKMNTNKVPQMGRNVIITPNSEASLLNVSELVNANTRGDDGSAQRNAHLGRMLGFDWFMCQNAPSVASGVSTTAAAAVDLTGGYAAGTTTLVIDGLTPAITPGSWCTIVGDMTPQKITAVTGGPPNTGMTISPGLQSAVADNAVITIYTPGAVDETAGYAAGYSKNLTVDGFTVAPQDGQLVSTGIGGYLAYNYGSMPTGTTTSILASHALEAAITDNLAVGLGPAGEYNFAFNRNAIALVSRPLAAPARGTGALSYVAQYKGLGVRVTITYEGRGQGHLVTVDFLCGTKVLDTDLGAVLFA